jgi:putative transposase
MLPKGLAKRSTAFDYFQRLGKKDGTWQKLMDALRRQVHTEAGRDPELTNQIGFV